MSNFRTFDRPRNIAKYWDDFLIENEISLFTITDIYRREFYGLKKPIFIHQDTCNEGFAYSDWYPFRGDNEFIRFQWDTVDVLVHYKKDDCIYPDPIAVWDRFNRKE